MKTLVLVSALLQPAPAPAVPALYSFNDVYRLTVNGAAMANFPPAAGPVRVAVSPEMRPEMRPELRQPPQPQPDKSFTIREVPAPERSLLLIAGLAAAFWVARRRMGLAF